MKVEKEIMAMTEEELRLKLQEAYMVRRGQMIDFHVEINNLLKRIEENSKSLACECPQVLVLMHGERATAMAYAHRTSFEAMRNSITRLHEAAAHMLHASGEYRAFGDEATDISLESYRRARAAQAHEPFEAARSGN